MASFLTRRTLAAVFIAKVLCFFAIPSANANDLLDEVIAAYGGAKALRAIEQIEYDSAGYFIGRYQSRTTHPPYDRLPVRWFTALDYDSERAVQDSISAWPGELNMGTRTVINGDRSMTLNTISRVYTDSAMQSFSGLQSNTALMLTPMLVRNMMDNREAVRTGQKKTFRYVEYDTLLYRDYTIYIHTATRLIHAIESEGGAMWDHTLDEGAPVKIIRYYDGYVRASGVSFPTRYYQYVNDETTQDRAIYNLAVNKPIDAYLQLPDGFELADTSGYGGEGWDIAVREAGRGLYVTGNGETHVLYVEMDDYFVVLEPGDFPSHAERTFEAMQPYMKGKPIKYIVPLHHHDDHAWAVHYYARNGATVLTTPDKEGFLRKLLARTWGEDGPVTDAKFEFFDGNHLKLRDRSNSFDLFVWPEAPHSENMVIGYHEDSKSVFTGDFYLGWGVPEGSSVRQGAGYGVRQLDRWIKQRQRSGEMGDVENYIAVHGRPYARSDMEKMLSTERTIVTLPNNEAWPTATWPRRFGLHDDTAQTPRREKMFRGEQ